RHISTPSQKQCSKTMAYGLQGTGPRRGMRTILCANKLSCKVLWIGLAPSGRDLLLRRRMNNGQSALAAEGMMASPFPGMDPYLERHWGDVHHSLITYVRDHLQRMLPKDLRARVEERVFVESPEDGYRAIIPDVRVIERGRRKGKRTPDASGLAVAEPL